MNNKSDLSHQWSVYAELTVDHQNPNVNLPLNPNLRLDPFGKNVEMKYTFVTNPTKGPNLVNPTERINRSPPKSYGFQRGNIMFTSSPPNYTRNRTQSEVNTEDFKRNLYAPNLHQNDLSNRTPRPYEKRCKSTCSITLSTDFQVDAPDKSQCPPYYPQYNCNFNSCGTQCKISYCPHACNKSSTKDADSKDINDKSNRNNFRNVTTQTVQTRDVCTSPIEKFIVDSTNKSDSEVVLKQAEKSFKKRNTNIIRRKSDSVTGKQKRIKRYGNFDPNKGDHVSRSILVLLNFNMPTNIT